MKPEVNLAALREKHLAAVRWESVRAAWFERCGDNSAYLDCRMLMKYHQNAADEALFGKAANV